MKNGFILGLFLSALSGCPPIVLAQKTLTVTKNDHTAQPLADGEQIFVCPTDDQLQRIPALKKLGQCVFVGRKDVGRGIDVHAPNIDKRARKWGSNLVKIDSHIINKRYDSLFVTLYLAPDDFLSQHFGQCAGKQLVLINDSPKNERVVRIDGQSVTLPPQSEHAYPVRTMNVSLSLGSRLLTTSAKIDFSKKDCRYFKLGGYGVYGTVPSGAIGLGVKSPELTELSPFAAALYMASVTKH